MWAPLHPGGGNKKGKMNNCQVLSETIQICWYCSILRNLISSVHSQHYEKYAKFEDNFLLALTSDDIYWWM